MQQGPLGGDSEDASSVVHLLASFMTVKFAHPASVSARKTNVKLRALIVVRYCLTIQIPPWRDTPTGEWLHKFDNHCITQTIHNLKGWCLL